MFARHRYQTCGMKTISGEIACLPAWADLSLPPAQKCRALVLGKAIRSKNRTAILTGGKENQVGRKVDGMSAEGTARDRRERREDRAGRAKNCWSRNNCSVVVM